jgi:hypothetical protein
MLYDGLYNMGQYNNRRDSVSNLPTVSDPEATFAAITRQDYDDYINNFRGFEEKLLKLTDDDSLIKQAREDQTRQNQIAQQVQQRNIERYGGAGLSNAQRQEQQRTLQRGGQLGLTNSLNNARVQQRTVNDALLNELIGIGQGVNQSSLSGLGDASAMAANRASAYKNAKAQHHGNMVGLGVTALGALFGI